jgi:hypothetical protein
MKILQTSEILDTLIRRNDIAVKKGYDNFSHMLLLNDRFFIRECCDTLYFINFLQDELDLLMLPKPSSEGEDLKITFEDALDHCFFVIGEIFDFDIEKEGSLYLLKDVNHHVDAADGNDILGYFTLNLFNKDQEECLIIGGPVNMLTSCSINMNLVKGQGLNDAQLIKLWSQMGKCIQHMTTDLVSLPRHIYELGSMFMEEACLNFYDMIFDRVSSLKKDIAIALVDLVWHSDKMNTEKDVMSVINDIQDIVGVNLCIDDFEPVISGGYESSYFTYAWCRKEVRENNIQVFNMITQSYRGSDDYTRIEESEED